MRVFQQKIGEAAKGTNEVVIVATLTCVMTVLFNLCAKRRNRAVRLAIKNICPWLYLSVPIGRSQRPIGPPRIRALIRRRVTFIKPCTHALRGFPPRHGITERYDPLVLGERVHGGKEVDFRQPFLLAAIAIAGCRATVLQQPTDQGARHTTLWRTFVIFGHSTQAEQRQLY